jgi:hypothetical protein
MSDGHSGHSLSVVDAEAVEPDAEQHAKTETARKRALLLRRIAF